MSSRTRSIVPAARSACAPRPHAGSGVVLGEGAELLGRILLAALFFISGAAKVGNYAAIATYMASGGVPPSLLPLVIATELLGSVAIALGWKTRVTAVLLAGYSVLTALLFHMHLQDAEQAAMFLKNLAIAGGFILLVVNGPGSYSLDRRKSGLAHNWSRQ